MRPPADRLGKPCGSITRSGTAGSPVRAVRKVELPFSLRQAPAGDLAGPGLPRNGIDVPDPRLARIRDDEEPAAVRRERRGDLFLRPRPRERPPEGSPGGDIPHDDLTTFAGCDEGSPV